MTAFVIRKRTGETPHYSADAACPETGCGTLTLTNHYIVFLERNKKRAELFPLLSVTGWGVDMAGQVPAFWIEGNFEQGSGKYTWHTDQHKDIMETVTDLLEKGAVAKKRAALARNQEKLNSYMTAVNTVLNQHSKVILLEDKAPLDDKADTLLQNAQPMLDAMWELFMANQTPYLPDHHDDWIGVLRDQVQCYGVLKGNRIAKIVLEARGYVLPAEDVFVDSDAFIEEYYQTALPPFEILEKVYEDVSALTQRLLPAVVPANESEFNDQFNLEPDAMRFLVSETVQLGYRVTIANAMVIAKLNQRIRIA